MLLQMTINILEQWLKTDEQKLCQFLEEVEYEEEPDRQIKFKLEE